MHEKLFRRAYETQEQLRSVAPDHELARKKYMSNAQEGCYGLCVDHDFLMNYPQNGIGNQLEALVRDFEKAIKTCEKPTETITK